MSDITRILSQSDSGDPQAAEKLLPLVYGSWNSKRRIALTGIEVGGNIGAGPADKGVGTKAASQRVVAVTAVERVVAVAAGERVVSCLAHVMQIGQRAGAGR